MNDDYSRTRTFAELKQIKPEKLPSQRQISNLIDQFDWDSKYGPCSGMTREDRYNRAVVNGLNPPSEINGYLNSKPHPHSQFYKLC
ncbi:unnamed protein product [Paramecium sonneborni]|uniref:Uncharacterized protein n=1 Tax=Paramecium sonneborni TaxID=65129 RepID=A0A8S1MMQ8_9CILI|nr:unnamed protein product [Paramecium sonneborni]